MNICVFGNYKITVKGNYSYYDVDEDWHTNEYEYTKELNGCDLIKIIQRCIDDRTLISFSVNENKFVFEHFDPLSGEDKNCEIICEAICCPTSSIECIKKAIKAK